jgi:hypothetical protein
MNCTSNGAAHGYDIDDWLLAERDLGLARRSAAVLRVNARCFSAAIRVGTSTGQTPMASAAAVRALWWSKENTRRLGVGSVSARRSAEHRVGSADRVSP